MLYRTISLLISGLLLSACTLTRSTSPTATLTPTPTAAPTETPAATPAATFTATPQPLTSSTGAYADATALLDGVCFEYLQTLAGQSWLWDSADDMVAFFERVDDSELCPEPVAHPAFTFDTQALVGTVFAGTGCDAAFEVQSWEPNAEQVYTLTVQITLRTGCPYELVEPLIIAVPLPPPGTIHQVIALPPKTGI